MDIKTPYIWKNGDIISWDKTLDHNLIHSLHYGGGVFEGIRFYNTKDGVKIFRLKEHIDRLFYSANVLSMKIPFSKKQIINATIKIVKKSKEKQGYIRPIVYYGYGKMGLNPSGAKIETVISVWHWGKYLSDKAIDVKISNINRIHPKTTDMNAKITGNYANSILVSLEIKKDGYDEGLLLDTTGNIAEGPGENIFFVKNKALYTPSLGNILPGITRDTIKMIYKDYFNKEVIEKEIIPEELKTFDEAFFVGTAAETTLIGSITDLNNKKIIYNSGNNSSFSNKIKKLYLDLVNGKIDKYKTMLF